MMENQTFKQLLFKTAFCCMACDGHIDDREIKELKHVNNNTKYFDGLDISDVLIKLVDQFAKIGKQTVEELFIELSNIELNTVQELLILEVALRIIHADEQIDENEVKFVRFLRSKLKVHDETILDRFGEVDILFNKQKKNELIISPYDTTDSFTMPDIDKLKDINISNDM